MAETYMPVPGYETADYIDDQVVCITSDKKIGSMAGQTSIQGEANSQYILYEIDRYHDGVDLSDKLLQIHYERQDGAGGNSTPVNVCVSDSRIRFGWIVPGSATALDGTLKVMPFATGLSPMGDTYIIKTLYTEYKVHKGLTVSGGIEEPDEDWYQAFVGRIAQYMDTAKAYASLAAGYERNAGACRDQAKQMAGDAAASASEAARSAVSAAESAQAIGDRESEAAGFAGQSQSYAVGTNGEVRENDDLDCAKSYYEQAKTLVKNLENGQLTFDINNQAPTFIEASKRENINSNETFPIIFGKIKKIFTDIKNVAFSGSYNDLSDKPDIPTIPESLPADGGDADTVGGKSVEHLQNYDNLSNKPDLFSGNYSDLKDAPEAPTAENLGIISTQATASLSTAWTGAEAPYSQVLTVSGVTTDSIVDIDVASTVTAEQLDAYINAKIIDGGQAAGSITLKAFGDKPEVAIPIKIVVRKV